MASVPRFYAKLPDDEGWAGVFIDPSEDVAALKKVVLAELKLDVSPASVTLTRDGDDARLDDASVVRDVLAACAKLIVHVHCAQAQVPTPAPPPLRRRKSASPAPTAGSAAVSAAGSAAFPAAAITTASTGGPSAAPRSSVDAPAGVLAGVPEVPPEAPAAPAAAEQAAGKRKRGAAAESDAAAGSAPAPAVAAAPLRKSTKASARADAAAALQQEIGLAFGTHFRWTFPWVVTAQTDLNKTIAIALPGENPAVLSRATTKWIKDNMPHGMYEALPQLSNRARTEGEDRASIKAFLGIAAEKQPHRSVPDEFTTGAPTELQRGMLAIDLAVEEAFVGEGDGDFDERGSLTRERYDYIRAIGAAHLPSEKVGLTWGAYDDCFTRSLMSKPELFRFVRFCVWATRQPRCDCNKAMSLVCGQGKHENKFVCVDGNRRCTPVGVGRTDYVRPRDATIQARAIAPAPPEPKFAVDRHPRASSAASSAASAAALSVAGADPVAAAARPRAAAGPGSPGRAFGSGCVSDDKGSRRSSRSNASNSGAGSAAGSGSSSLERCNEPHWGKLCKGWLTRCEFLNGKPGWRCSVCGVTIDDRRNYV